jgi:hypothetical protein
MHIRILSRAVRVDRWAGNGRQCLVPRQAATSAGTRVRAVTESDRRAAIDRLRKALIAGRNADGGWSYYTGKTSRLEPTCWALLALGFSEDSRALRDSGTRWLAQCQRPSGWLLEDATLPVNIAFNALAALTLLHQRDGAFDEVRRRLLAAVTTAKGMSAPQSDAQRQDNSLQGWSWTDATFSWVEPTSWGLLALKKARAAGIHDNAMTARIGEAERLMIDRSCRPGGWNFGNAEVLGQDLQPYVPTTALGLLAMQDRREHDVVTRGLATLEARWHEEISSSSTGVSLICLDVFGRPAGPLLTRLAGHTEQAIAFGNHHGIALAMFALSAHGQSHAFRL